MVEVCGRDEKRQIYDRGSMYHVSWYLVDTIYRNVEADFGAHGSTAVSCVSPEG